MSFANTLKNDFEILNQIYLAMRPSFYNTN